MGVLRIWARLPRHFFLLWRAGQLRFRLETFGLFYPALPYKAAWWRINPVAAVMLLGRLPSYVVWLAEMEDIQSGGPEAWWTQRYPRRAAKGRGDA